ncbi:MAG: hypothetical protein AB7O44_14805 [Hyphomicrobiaceae bacterium]|jgi:hypothetical protein
MSRYFFAAAVIAVSFSMPVTGAQAGFFTDVAKGTIKNAARHGKKTVKDAVALGRFVGPSAGRCLLKRATGRQC